MPSEMHAYCPLLLSEIKRTCNVKIKAVKLANNKLQATKQVGVTVMLDMNMYRDTDYFLGLRQSVQALLGYYLMTVSFQILPNSSIYIYIYIKSKVCLYV
jgi:hypothetical protein